MDNSPSSTQMRPEPGLGEITRVFLHTGLVSFGGPAGQIALMHRTLVEEKRWIREEDFLHALGYCMLLPGPEAQQLATYTGWLLRGWRGGVIAGVLFILPGFFTVVALSAIYAIFHQADLLAGLFFGLKAAILVVILQSLTRLMARVLKTPLAAALAAAAFIALHIFSVPFPVVVVLAGLAGAFVAFATGARTGPEKPVAVADMGGGAASGGSTLMRTLGCILLWLAIWQIPAILLLLPGTPGVMHAINMLFSWLSMVTFGGAYAALAWVAQVAVDGRGWLSAGEMLDGLALAETTPGPLVLVMSWVGFLAGFRQPDGMEPLLAGILGATVAAWATFVPGFMWIFAGAPYVEKVRNSPLLSAALAGVTSAVVGVMLNLALWFGLHVLFAEVGRVAIWPVAGDSAPVAAVTWPVLASIDLPALFMTSGAGILVFYARMAVLPVLFVCGAAGWLWHMLT